MKLGIVGEIRFYREGLAAMLSREPDIEVRATAPRASDVFVMAEEVDIVLLDMSTPGALEALQVLAARRNAPRVVGMAVSEAESAILECAVAGISGYVSRDDSVPTVVAAIHSAARGETACPARFTTTLVRHVRTVSGRQATAARPEAKLTRRETEIMELLDQGLSNKEIARRLCIELPTVKNHVHHILEKLNVARRGEAVARRRGA